MMCGRCVRPRIRVRLFLCGSINNHGDLSAHSLQAGAYDANIRERPSRMTESDLHRAAEKAAATLRQAGRRLVLAESCTGGLVAASLAQIPGVSEHLCGSAVVYRNATKTAWLGIDAALLADPAIGPVSSAVTNALAVNVLRRTPEADVAAAVTGHLGPNAPPELDGTVYVAVAVRSPQTHDPSIVCQEQVVLPSSGADAAAARVERQRDAAQLVLDAVRRVLGA